MKIAYHWVNVFEDCCWIGLTAPAIGHGEEMKFQNYQNWQFYGFLDVIDPMWSKSKTLESHSSPMVDHWKFGNFASSRIEGILGLQKQFVADWRANMRWPNECCVFQAVFSDKLCYQKSWPKSYVITFQSKQQFTSGNCFWPNPFEIARSLLSPHIPILQFFRWVIKQGTRYVYLLSIILVGEIQPVPCQQPEHRLDRRMSCLPQSYHVSMLFQTITTINC